MSIIEFVINNNATFLALVAAGMFAGILAGLLGVGGGIVIVPVLFFLFQSCHSNLASHDSANVY